MPILEVSEVCVAFGGAQVLSDVSLTVAEKGVTGLIGRTVPARHPVQRRQRSLGTQVRRVSIDGHDVTKAGPARRARRGWRGPTSDWSSSPRSRCGQHPGGRRDPQLLEPERSYRRCSRDGPHHRARRPGRRGRSRGERVADGTSRVVEVARALMTQRRCSCSTNPPRGRPSGRRNSSGSSCASLSTSGTSPSAWSSTMSAW